MTSAEHEEFVPEHIGITALIVELGARPFTDTCRHGYVGQHGPCRGGDDAASLKGTRRP